MSKNINLIKILLLILTGLVIFISPAIANQPQRIISLAPNITEILYALNLEDKIVGITDHCDFPKETKDKKRVGGMINPSIEEIVRLKPDIVILTKDGNPKEIQKRLENFKINTYLFNAERLGQLRGEIILLGKKLGFEEKSKRVARQIEDSINRIKKTNEKSNFRNKKTVFIIWMEPLIVAGNGTAIDDAIRLLGWENIVSHTKLRFPRYSIEKIIRQSPDVILIGMEHKKYIETVSGKFIERIQSVKNDKNIKICYVGDSIYRLSPRIISGILEMSNCLR